MKSTTPQPAATSLSTAESSASVFDTAPTGRWSAAYTKPRQEKALAADLLERGVPHFLPLVERVVVSGGRRRRRMLPLFASYVFFLDEEPYRLSALRTNRIARLVTPSEPEQELFVEQLRALELALQQDPGSVEMHPGIKDGARVEIIGGAMKGIVGVVMDSGNLTKVWLQVTALGTGALVEMPADLLSPVD